MWVILGSNGGDNRHVLAALAHLQMAETVVLLEKLLERLSVCCRHSFLPVGATRPATPPWPHAEVDTP